MSDEELPAGWERVRLGDILLSIDAGRSFTCEPRPAEDGEWGVIKVSAMTWGSFAEKENKAVPANRTIDPRHEIKPGDVLLSRANTEAYVGAPVLVGNCRSRLLLSDKSLRLTPGVGINRSWLVYALSSPTVRSQISAASTGAQESMRNISQVALANVRLLLPPLAEQLRIVIALEYHLSRLDAGSGLLAQQSERLSSYQLAVLDLLSKGALVDGPIGPLVPAGEVAEIQGGIQKQQKRRPVENAYPFLRVANVGRRELNLADVHKIELFKGELCKFRLADGDLLVVEGNGSAVEVGRAALWRNEISNAVHQNHLIRVRPGERLDPAYLELLWNAPSTRDQLTKLASSTSGLHTLSVRKLNSLMLRVPALTQQMALVAEARRLLDAGKLLRSEISKSASRASHLRRSLLADAFAGRLVHQDPADEPASALMTRIAAEHAKHVPGKTPRQPRRTTAQNAMPAQLKRPAPPPSDKPVPSGAQEGLF